MKHYNLHKATTGIHNVLPNFDETGIARYVNGNYHSNHPGIRSLVKILSKSAALMTSCGGEEHYRIMFFIMAVSY